MNRLTNLFLEIFGLFVDDGSFALAIVLWLAAVWFLLGQLNLHTAAGVVLFLGLAAILLESVARFARKAAP